jgi:hypothetical protein
VLAHKKLVKKVFIYEFLSKVIHFSVHLCEK